MYGHFRTSVLAAASALGAAAVLPTTDAGALGQVLYIVKDLGTLGGSSAIAVGVSDRGSVAGAAQVSGDKSAHAFL